MANRSYTEKEVLALLRKAAEFQASGAPSSVEGVSELQVRAMAIELGISPEAIDMALRTGADAPVRPRASRIAERLIGAPIDADIDLTLDGEVDGELWADYVHSLRKRFGSAGSIGTVGRAFEWSNGEHELLGVFASASGKNGRTRFRATLDGWGALFLSGLVPLLSLTLLGWNGQSLGFRFLLVLLCFGAYYGFGLRMLFGAMFRRRYEAFQAAAEEFRTTIAAKEPTTTIEVPVIETEAQNIEQAS